MNRAYFPKDAPLFLPFTISEDTVVDGNLMWKDNGVLRLSAIMGRRQSSGLPVAHVVAETPFRKHPAIKGKAQHEELVVQSFLSQGMGIPNGDFELRPGSDPPDVVAKLDNRGETLIEVAQLMTPGLSPAKLRNAFARVTERLIKHCGPLSNELRPHAGYTVYIHFDHGSLASPSRTDNSLVEMTVDLLCNSRPQQVFGLPGEFPDRMPGASIQYSSDRRVGLSWMRNSYPSIVDPTWSALGFNLALSHDRELTANSLQTEVRRLVSNHDTFPSDILLLALGTPDRNGWVFPSSRVISSILALDEGPLRGFKPRKIKSVAVFDALEKPPRVRWIHGGPTWLSR